MVDSPNFHEGAFHNHEKTRQGLSPDVGYFSTVKRMLTAKNKRPKKPVPSEVFQAKHLENNMYSWFGHSTLAFNLEGTVIVTDPVFGRTSPVSFVGPKPFRFEHQPTIDLLPDRIDILLLTHDHYDHTERPTIKKIHDRVGTFVVALGMKQLLVKWGVDQEKIIEMDWYDEIRLHNIDIIFTPSRHFSGRSLKQNVISFWGGFVMKTSQHSVYLSGDGGYTKDFTEVREKYGPFDLMFVECGQYDIAWPDIHMFPEESVQAGIDAQAKVVVPIHWGRYSLSIVAWDDCVKRFVKAAQQLTYSIPKIGSIQHISSVQTDPWWE